MAAIAIIAKNQPNPPPKPKATDSPKLYSLATMNKEPPKIAQFTVINGKKIPKELYNFRNAAYKCFLSSSNSLKDIGKLKTNANRAVELSCRFLCGLDMLYQDVYKISNKNNSNFANFYCNESIARTYPGAEKAEMI